ncbi:MAG: PRC-barrel domain-containing protein [Rhodospirillales bacterium]|jgi:hypothetical protein|nr:PRC-barrel domain-containing protein [Rhodospirillales bacterium]
MSERARLARLTVCFVLAAVLAGASSVGLAAGDAPPSAEPSAPAAGEAPPESKIPDLPKGPPPLGPGLAGEGDVPPEQPAVDVAGGEEAAPELAPKNVRTIPNDEAAGILGKKVTGAAGEDVGMVVDVLIDAAGKPRAAVVDFGGFLGVGIRKIAVDWTFLQFRPGDRDAPVLLDVTADAIRAAPEYRPSDAEARVVVSPPAEESGDGDATTEGAGPDEPAAAKPAAAAPAPTVPEQAKPPPEGAHGMDRPPLPEMRPPDGRPKSHPPAAGVPSADDLGPAPEPALPQIPPDARQ